MQQLLEVKEVCRGWGSERDVVGRDPEVKEVEGGAEVKELGAWK